MNLLAGLREPQSGSILVDGINVRDLRPGTVGYVFQSPDHQFVDPTSVWNELAFGLKQLKYSEEMINQRVTSVLELFGLQGIKDTIPYDLSMGQKRFLSVATMLVLQPKILILDEPTTGLDARLTTKLMTILQKLVEEGMTVIQVSHDMEQIAQYCQRVVVIGSEGNIVFDDTPRTLFANQPVLQSTMLEAPPASRLAQTLWPNHSPLPITVEEFQLSGGNHATT
jgi:energy-coupling factor transport system ATP-binding protein